MNNYHFQSRVDRAFAQRIYLIDCKRPSSAVLSDDESDLFSNISTHKKYVFEIMGNSGTAYEITIPSNMEAVKEKVHCSCPDHDGGGNLCKHLLFVLIRVLGLTREKVFNDFYESHYQVTEEVINLCNEYMDKRDNIKLEGLDPNTGEHLDLNTKREVGEDDSCPICPRRFWK